MLTLAVDVYQSLSDLPQEGQGHRPTIDTADTAAFGPHLAREDEEVGLVAFQTFPLQERAQGGLMGRIQAEDSLHQGSVGAGAHDGGVGAAAQHQADCINDDGFSRSRFSGQDDEAGGEEEVEFVYDGKIANMEFGKHGLTQRHKGTETQEN